MKTTNLKKENEEAANFLDQYILDGENYHFSSNDEDLNYELTELRSDDVEKLNNKIKTTKQNKEDNEKVSISISKQRKKVDPLNPFVMIFISSFKEIIKDYNLGNKDIVLLLHLLEKMKYGNLVQITQTAIAKELNEKQPNISRSFKNLFSCGILVKDANKNIFINSQIINKQDLHKMKYENKELYDLSLSEMQKRYVNFEKNF